MCKHASRSMSSWFIVLRMRSAVSWCLWRLRWAQRGLCRVCSCAMVWLGAFSRMRDAHERRRGDPQHALVVSPLLAPRLQSLLAGMFKVIDEEGSGVVRWAAFRKWYTNNYTRFMEESQRDFFEDVPGEDSS